MNGIARQFPARPEPILGLSDIAHPPDIHLVGLRRSLVRVLDLEKLLSLSQV
jgi:hypothetical protein